jgi:hypothetical protein
MGSGQSKAWSIFESICNTMSGLILAYFIWNFIIIPLYIGEMELDMNQLSTQAVFGVNIIFTLFSVARGYIWRRIFNKRETNAQRT